MLIHQAQARFNSDMARSWMIGDSARDILCGRAAGVSTIGVRCGEGFRDAPDAPQPDRVFDDLPQAVSFILAPA